MLNTFLDYLELPWQKWLELCRRYPRQMYLVKFSIIFIILWLICYQRLDPDFGWHLTSGNYFRKYGIPTHDIYTYTARNFPWIDHEWGTDVIISVLYQIGGYILVSFLFAFLWTSALFTNSRKVPFPLLWLAAIATLPYVGIRPMIWTILGVALLIRVSDSKSRRFMYMIPIGFMFWANLQGGFFLGFVYLGYLLVKRKEIIWGWILLASVLLSFINPYGPRLYVEVFRTLSDSQIHHQIKEWSYFYIPVLAWFYILLWAVGFVAYTKRHFKNLLTFTNLIFVAMLSSSRNLPIFVITSLGDLGNYFAKTTASLPKRLDNVRRAVIDITVYTIVIFCIVISIYITETANNKTSEFPVQAVAYMSTGQCTGNVFNSYDYGGYLIWKLPSKSVYIDGRMPSWKEASGTKYLDTYFSILASTAAQQSQFNKYDITCALLSNDDSSSTRLIDSLKQQGWIDRVQANNSVLLVSPQNGQ